MKKTLFTLTIALCVLAAASVASSVAKNSNNHSAPETIEGYFVDEACVDKKAMWTNKECVLDCVKKGSELLLRTEGGKQYKLDQSGQSKGLDFAGEKVEVTGSVSGDTISVTSIKGQ